MRTRRSVPTGIARKLRVNFTEAEARLWYHLRNRQLAGYKFRRQYAVGRYVVDFVCLEAKLIVELDGGQHSEQLQRDESRTLFLVTQGFRALRFWNDEMFRDTEAVLSVIRETLCPSP
jgi:very-short-patch-repair endonuclease